MFISASRSDPDGESLNITTTVHANLLFCGFAALYLRQLQRQHVFLTTEAYNEMPTLRIEGHLNANALHV